MNGKQYQYDPQVMFKDWIQKSGSSQSEFIKNFSQMMGNNIPLEFDPLKTLNEITTKATETQNNILDNLSGIQKQGFEKMFNWTQMIPNLPDWGAYKTSVGSNGRISIPEAERNALGLKEGNLVQVIVLPISKKQKNKEVKK